MVSRITTITLAAASAVIIIFAASVQAQRPVPLTFADRSTGRAVASPLELEPQQPMPQPFRRVSLPLYRGRGFSMAGQELNVVPLLQAQQQQQTFQPRPLPSFENNDRVGNNEDIIATDAPQPTRLFQLQQNTDRVQQGDKSQQLADRNQLQVDRNQQQADRNQLQVDRNQQQADRNQQLADRSQQLANRNQLQVDRNQQQADRNQQQQFPGFRSSQPLPQHAEAQPQFVRKVVQRPLKRVQATSEETAASRSPETIQRLKLERSESADKQRAKKPVSQVLRRYRDDNPDGSITWGFENDDGTFKEETIGVDCVTRGKYGYVDPEGVKREYSYQSGILCDRDRKPLPTATEGSSPSAVQEAQASDTYGYIDYTKNQYVMANGQTIDLNGMAKNRARKPVVRKTVVAASPSAAAQQYHRLQ